MPVLLVVNVGTATPDQRSVDLGVWTGYRMGMVQIRVWVEVTTREHMVELTDEVPDEEWAALTEEAREARMRDMFTELQNQTANGGWEAIEDAKEGQP